MGMHALGSCWETKVLRPSTLVSHDSKPDAYNELQAATTSPSEVRTVVVRSTAHNDSPQRAAARIKVDVYGSGATTDAIHRCL